VLQFIFDIAIEVQAAGWMRPPSVDGNVDCSGSSGTISTRNAVSSQFSVVSPRKLLAESRRLATDGFFCDG
jgi:hypothetical protein